MKKLSPLLVLVLSLGLSSTGLAITMQIGSDIPKNGTGQGGGNGLTAADNFARLQSVVAASLATYPFLPTPVFTGYLDVSTNAVSGGQLAGYEYAVIHYGVGPGGIPESAGGIAVWFLDGVTDYTFPAMGTGANGYGGFSGITLFDSNAVPGNTPGVPDSGASLALFGAVLIGLAGVNHLLKRASHGGATRESQLN